jgi:hypothetical protein
MPKRDSTSPPSMRQLLFAPTRPEWYNPPSVNGYLTPQSAFWEDGIA